MVSWRESPFNLGWLLKRFPRPGTSHSIHTDDPLSAEAQLPAKGLKPADGPQPKEAFFRANVGAMIFDLNGRVMVLRRADVSPPTWQLPQGGLHVAEDPRDALAREIGEETGLGPDDYAILAEYPRWLAYELPVVYQSPRLGMGQVQKWFVCRLVDDLAVVRPDEVEFDAFKWVCLDEMVMHAVEFRRSIYEQLASFAADIVKHSILIDR